MLFLLSLIILGLGVFIFIQYEKHDRANKLYNQAKELEKKDTENPLVLTQLNHALALYKQCNKLVNHSTYIKAANQCQKKIDDSKKFQNLFALGKKKTKQGFFKEALDDFLKAKRLFAIEELKDEISKCQQSIKQQENYEKILEQSTQLAVRGQFQEAINFLKPALHEFSREDGQQLLTKLERVIQAKELFNLGLIGEKAGDFNQAQVQYEQALNLLPEFTECKIRLSAITVETHPNKAISYLERTEGEQAAYIHGFAHTRLRNWQQAYREWKAINSNQISSQREIIKSLAERDRLSKIKEIESAIDCNKFEIAKTLSLEFIDKFGTELTVQQNLESHIQPLLERQICENHDGQKIAAKTQQTWLKQQDINSLHNWAIATYYQAQTNPHKLLDFIIAWSTALANMKHNPTLHNIPWLGSNSVDIKDVSAKLKQILENAIDVVKDSNINEYLKFRDIYRREMLALSLIQQNNCGIRIKQQLFILPGCYQRFRNYLPRINFPAKVWGSLYTDWGLAVAACYENDIARAIKIKPGKNPISEAERFACNFISYHEGCYYLQNLEWRKAIKLLQQAKSEIKAKSDWCKEIDRLCEAQRQNLDEFDKHLQFSKFWYELIDSQPSKSYFAEQSAIQVGLKIDDKKISLSQGLDELRAIRNNIDRNNATTLNIIEKVEYTLAAEKVDRLLKDNQYREAIKVAKRSQNEAICFRLAEIFIDVILQGAENRSLDFDGMYQLARWAYELCPREPAFMPIYRELKIGNYS